MSNKLLLPSYYKVIGWISLLVFAALGAAVIFKEFKIPGFQLYTNNNQGLLDFNDYNLTNELALIGTILSLLSIAFSKEKNEDEYISYLRLKSWQWSVLISYLILIVISLCFYGTTFFGVIFYNIFTILIVFIIKFQFSLYQLRREDEYVK